MKMIAFLIVVLFGSSVYAEPHGLNKGPIRPLPQKEWNNGKKWSEMTIEEKKASMDKLQNFNSLMEANALRKGGFLDITEYNSAKNPTFDENMSKSKAEFDKWQVKPKYIHNAWTGNWMKGPYRHLAWLGDR